MKNIPSPKRIIVLYERISFPFVEDGVTFLVRGRARLNEYSISLLVKNYIWIYVNAYMLSNTVIIKL